MDFQLQFNLGEQYSELFTKFKQKFKDLITGIHSKVAQNTNQSNLLTEANLIKFETQFYQVDIRDLKATTK